jgi:uncharacterized protein YwgA
MKTYDFVHLVLYAFDGSIQGRTKLQKIVYFVGVLTDLHHSLGYHAHFYGPYSSEVTAAINELQGLGFLRQTSSSAGAIDPHGFEVARYDYTLTPEGEQIAQEKAERFPGEWTRIREVAEHLKSLNATDYVKLSIAAKAYFLLGAKGGKATIAELLGTMPRFGWKVTKDQMAEAGEFLRTMGLIHRPDSR